MQTFENFNQMLELNGINYFLTSVAIYSLSHPTVHYLNYFLDLYFPPEWLKAALVLTLMSTWVLVGLFAYLNRYTQRPYFTSWTAGWLFYALWIISMICFVNVKNPPSMEWINLACIGVCATFLFWGSLQFQGNDRCQREMGLAIFMIVLWSYVAHIFLAGSLWFSLPLFLILSLASFLTAGCFFQDRFNRQYVGASILGLGFTLWGIQMASQPFVDVMFPTLRPTLFVGASTTQLVIAIGMIVLMLEEVRGETILLRNQIKADVHLTQQLQKEITISENKYEHLFKHARDVILIVNPVNLRILEANHAAEILTGYSREELLRLRLVNLYPCLQDKEKEIAKNPNQVQEIFTTYGNLSLQRKDNSLIMTEGSASLMDDDETRIIQIFLREVTERHRLEQQLRQAEKFSSLGQLIAGVAHELNNPLAVINGYAQLLVTKSTMDEKMRDDLLKIQRESEQASKIVQNFLALAREHPMEKINVDINELIKVSLELLEYDLKTARIRLVQELTPNLPEVFADPNQLEQVFLNIINHAIRSIEDQQEKMLKIRTESSSACVKVIVMNYGKGIPDTVLEKIFDPFFTTKIEGGKTGLGLSIAYSIVKEHSGNIYAQNHSQGGVTFTVELPISNIRKSQPGYSNKLPSKKSSTTLPCRLSQVLVIDEGKTIHDVFTELLMEYSCYVQSVTSCIQAMKLIQQQEFDLILCNLQRDGQKFYEEVKQIKPTLATKFIFITDAPPNPAILDFLRRSNNRWLSKPFNFREVEKLLADHFWKIQEEEGLSTSPPKSG